MQTTGPDVRCLVVVRSRSIAWSKAEPFGAEFVEVVIESDLLTAQGVAIGSAPTPYRLDYELATSRRHREPQSLAEFVGHRVGDEVDAGRLDGPNRDDRRAPVAQALPNQGHGVVGEESQAIRTAASR